jgi:hypothetical protein
MVVILSQMDAPSKAIVGEIVMSSTLLAKAYVLHVGWKGRSTFVSKI